MAEIKGTQKHFQNRYYYNVSTFM